MADWEWSVFISVFWLIVADFLLCHRIRDLYRRAMAMAENSEYMGWGRLLRGVQRINLGHEPDRKDGGIWWIVVWPCLVSRFISIPTYFGSVESKSRTIVRRWVMMWLILLIVFAVIVPPRGNWALAFLALALYRLQDLLFSTLDDTLQITGRFQGSLGETKILTALVNIVQTVLIFTIAILVLTSASDWGMKLLTRPDAFFISWGGLTPFAVNNSAHDSLAKVLMVVESAIAVLIVLIALSRFVGLTPKDPCGCDKATEGAQKPAEVQSAS